jgi:hypothetical protein
VFLISDAYRAKAAKRKPIVSRTIQIRGDQTLEVLHEFHFGKRPTDPRIRRGVLSFVLPSTCHEVVFISPSSTFESLGLKVGTAFYYWWDFGAELWHQINVEGIDDNVPTGNYPKLVKQVGESPPQYPEEDEEDQ